MDSEESSDSDDGTQTRIILNVANTQYPVVREIGRKLKWKLSHKDGDDTWDVCWIDTGMAPEKLLRMKPYQKINHFPGMSCLSRKNTLAVNLNLMRKMYPQQYSFFPPSWVLPAESRELRAQFGDKHNRTFIVKPEAGCQGRGIFLVRRYEDIPVAERFVVQRYLHRPLLIDGLKFDLRVYVLLAGCDPLRIFIHEEGLARFATEPYESPLRSNLSEMCIHLTNYAINKNNPNFVFNQNEARDDIGHKKSLTALFRLLQKLGHDTTALWREICAIVVKTLCCGQPLLRHVYRSCQPLDVTNGMCFEILGFDIFLDYKCRPWLLEVNHSPSFTTDTPLDHSIKSRVIADAISLLDTSVENRSRLGLQRAPLRGRSEKDSRLELLRKQRRAVEETQRLERQHTGGFKAIFPAPNSEEFEELLEGANRLWSERNPRSLKYEALKQMPKPKPKGSASPFKWQSEPSQEEPNLRRSSVISSLRTQARIAVCETQQPEEIDRVTASLRCKMREMQQKAASELQDRMRPLANGIFIKPRLIDFDNLDQSKVYQET